jgi:hypothetical protein
MKLQGLVALVSAMFTPNVDRIISVFDKTLSKLENAARVHNEQGSARQDEARDLMRQAAASYQEAERAERIADNLRSFIGK